jgi:hypothetical protein
MKTLFVIALVMTSFNVFAQFKPYKIVMFTDADAKAKAEQFKEYLTTKPPFSKMGDKLTLEIVELTPEEMDCKNDNPSAPRIVSCNNKLFRKTQRKMDAHLSLAFTSKAKGGAGGDIPIASNDYPIQTMFHEMLHTYGLADEYDYSASERTVYCDRPRSKANIVYFKDVPPYENDVAARSKHNRDVPWMGGIPQARLITKGTSLGSEDTLATPGSQLLGLFRGGSCDSAATPGWRPYGNSIMRGYSDDTIYPLYEEIIVKNIEGSLGRRLQLPPPPQKCLDENFDFTKIQHLHSDIEEAVKHVH